MHSPDFLPPILTLAVTFVISTATLMTGFGIGTVLTPVFALFYDIKTAILLVSLVHFANNLLKFALFGRHMNRDVFVRFGAVSILGAVAGTLLQGRLDTIIVGYALGLFLVITGISEFFPLKKQVMLPQNLDRAGGFLSGFMGGLIGNQGAIRSAYLLNYNLSKEAFIGTATAISMVIDLTRIPLYVYQESSHLKDVALPLSVVIVVAFGGTLVGTQLLKKISLDRFRLIVASFLVVIGVRFFLT